MIEIIDESGEKTSFTNQLWVTLNGQGEAENVFLENAFLSHVDSHSILIKSQDGLPEQDLFKLIQSGIAFSEVNMSPAFNLMEKSRLLRIKAALTEHIAKNA